MSVKENLIAAKALIDNSEKWTKGSFHRGECRCVVGAIGDIPDVNGRGDILTCLRNHLPEPWRGRALMDFNDAPETTHADIMALFDRAILSQDKM